MKRSRLERLGALFWRSPLSPSAARALDRFGEHRFATARGLIHAFYAVVFFFAAGELFLWESHLASTPLDTRWAVFWLDYVDTRTGIAAILWLYLVGTLLGVAASRYRWARILVFVALLEFLSFRYSFGSMTNADHLTILIAFVLIWLPAGWATDRSRRTRTAALLGFSGAQAMILLTYTMAGFWKVNGVVRQMLQGEVNALMPRGLAQQVAAKLLEDDATSLLGPWFIEHPLVGWPLMVATIYLQFFALWIVARPTLHLWWGLGLILFHLSSHLLMGVGFPQNTLWLALFLVGSPFRPSQLLISETLRELPLVGRPLLAGVQRAGLAMGGPAGRPIPGLRPTSSPRAAAGPPDEARRPDSP